MTYFITLFYFKVGSHTFHDRTPIISRVNYVMLSGDSEKKCNTKVMVVTLVLVSCVVLLLVTVTLLVIQWRRPQSTLKVHLMMIGRLLRSQTGARLN